MKTTIDKSYYLKKAEENFPKLYTEEISVVNEVKELYPGDSFVLDLGNHYVGYLSFTLGFTNRYPDAPTRLSVKFCERPYEIDADFSEYTVGLCASWLQEEIVTVDYLGEYKMPRRYAARYIKITVLAAPKRITLSNFIFSAVTSADRGQLESIRIDDEELLAIDRVSVNTLKNCMQRVFEDGPKRDRRLWIGDLRLEALANYYTYHQTDLVRRCLYLFAASECDKTGVMPGYIYEYPFFYSGCWFLRDYALLFAVTLCEYYLYTGDEQTFLEIYPVAKGQMDAMLSEMDENGILVPNNSDNVFIDHIGSLKKTTSLNGIYLYTLKILIDTLSLLNHEDTAVYRSRYEAARESARRSLYNQEQRNFENAYDEGQLSVHSVVWMILGGVLEGEEAWELLQSALQNETYWKPVSPYMIHYLIEAMEAVGKEREAMSCLREFWGAMVKEGADTFYEIFTPKDPQAESVERLTTSMCHAWSSTPSYFIRKRIVGDRRGTSIKMIEK